MPTNEGLFKLDIIDHHAVLGLSLAADPIQVRKRYLEIAHQLHPDSLHEASKAQKKLASDLFSKQVNPAYEVLRQNRSVKEHKILLEMKQQQLVTRPILLSAKSESAKKLLGTSNLEMDYTSAVNRIAKDQFNDLTRVESAINELSELNAVFLMRKGSVGEKKGRSAGDAVVKPSEPAETAPRRPKHEAIIESYLSRAKEFAYKRDYSRAILELREAIAAHPQSASCHSYLASLYLQANQATLAKIHAKQALVFDAENDMAKEVQAKLNAKATKVAPAKAASAKKGGGLLSGLFSKKR